ncbi:hypothetical protein PFICI_06603 [Pestalotiopsis fici W106-1]|uniref:Uncharacterized protein n=1 Tax=Pestalotiopsis fici (strain W106-1 / CGMCC3.15140) TaxID=1229662 RepID=W3X8U4_PESFW|nr:uncharacterized protein PFICI_06603 [Pestalotiopsis fici W106-1]ETS81601.1 hypothetical protein PFICI_06603 [Pestalotiopsis fici W106-1]
MADTGNGVTGADSNNIAGLMLASVAGPATLSTRALNPNDQHRNNAPVAAAESSKPGGSEVAETATIPSPSVADEFDDSSDSSDSSATRPVVANQPITPQSTGNNESQPANGTVDSTSHLAEDPCHFPRVLPDNLDDLPEESWDAACDVLTIAGEFLSIIGHPPVPWDPNVELGEPLQGPFLPLGSSCERPITWDNYLIRGDSGPRPVIHIKAKRPGAPDIQLKIHWDYQAECINMTEEEFPEAPAAAAEQTTTTAAPANASVEPEPEPGPEPVQQQAEAQAEEEINPHSLPEIHHQPRSAAPSQPALGPHDPANPAARPPNQRSFISQSQAHFVSSAPTPVFVHQQSPFVVGQPMPMIYGVGQQPQQQYSMPSFMAQQQPGGVMGNEPYLLINPPVVSPGVQAPPIGTGGYPNWRQSPFHNGTAHWRTNPPIIVGQPGAQPVFMGGQTHNVIMYR